MDEIMDLFDPRNLARTSDPVTSHQAAASAAAFAGAHPARVLDALPAGLQLGAEEIGDRIGMDAYQVRKRLPELKALGLASPTDRTRTTRSGRGERIWVRA